MTSLAKKFDITIKSRSEFGVGLRIGDMHYTMNKDTKFSAENVNSFVADVLAGKLQGKLIVSIFMVFLLPFEDVCPGEESFSRS